jgi:hypothetical protein
MTSRFSRLRDQEGTDVERLLLGSAEGDVPAPAVRAQTLAALGLVGVTAAVAGTAHAASAAVVGSAGGKVASSATALTLVKWLVVGAVAGATTTGTVVVATTPNLFGDDETAAASRPLPARPAPPGLAATSKGPAPNVRTQAEPPERRDPAAPLPEPAVPRTRVLAGEELAAAPQGTAFPVAGADTVAEEVAALDRVRSALASGDARGAVVRLDAYESRYPRGTLAPEATVLRVRALVQLGRSRDARAVVDAFVRAHPRSPQAARLHALVGE